MEGRGKWEGGAHGQTDVQTNGTNDQLAPGDSGSVHHSSTLPGGRVVQGHSNSGKTLETERTASGLKEQQDHEEGKKKAHREDNSATVRVSFQSRTAKKLTRKCI